MIYWIVLLFVLRMQRGHCDGIKLLVDYDHVNVTLTSDHFDVEVCNLDIKKKRPDPFESILQSDVPKGRDGKHKQIVERLLRELGELKPGMAMKIPLDELPDTKENIRSALSRAASLHQIDIATSSNDKNLFVWKKNGRSG